MQTPGKLLRRAPFPLSAGQRVFTSLRAGTESSLYQGGMCISLLGIRPCPTSAAFSHPVGQQATVLITSHHITPCWHRTCPASKGKRSRTAGLTYHASWERTPASMGRYEKWRKKNVRVAMGTANADHVTGKGGFPREVLLSDPLHQKANHKCEVQSDPLHQSTPTVPDPFLLHRPVTRRPVPPGTVPPRQPCLLPRGLRPYAGTFR